MRDVVLCVYHGSTTALARLDFACSMTTATALHAARTESLASSLPSPVRGTPQPVGAEGEKNVVGLTFRCLWWEWAWVLLVGLTRG